MLAIGNTKCGLVPVGGFFPEKNKCCSSAVGAPAGHWNRRKSPVKSFGKLLCCLRKTVVVFRILGETCWTPSVKDERSLEELCRSNVSKALNENLESKNPCKFHIISGKEGAGWPVAQTVTYTLGQKFSAATLKNRKSRAVPKQNPPIHAFHIKIFQ